MQFVRVESIVESEVIETVDDSIIQRQVNYFTRGESTEMSRAVDVIMQQFILGLQEEY